MKLKGLKPRLYNILFHTHTVSGIAISFALFVIFYAGTFAFFRHEIYRWEHNDARYKTAMSFSHDKVLETVRRHNPQFDIHNLFTIRPGTDLVPYVRFSGAYLPDEKTKEVKRFLAYIDVANDYSYTEMSETKTTLATTIYHLHYFRQIPFGLYISGFVGLFFLFATVTGVIIHWRNIFTKFYSIVFEGKWKLIWTNMHTVLGMIGLPFQIIYGITGAFFGLLTLLMLPPALVLFGGDTDKVVAMVRPEAQFPLSPDASEINSISLDTVISKGEEIFGEYPITFMRVNHYGLDDGFCLVNAAEESSIVRSGVGIFDISDGSEKYVLHPEKVTYDFAVLSFITQLHFGSFGGILLRIAYFILGLLTCVMLLAGVMLWKEARMNKRYTDQQKKFHHRVTKIYLAICLSMFPAFAIIFIANKMVPWELEDRTFYVNTIFFSSWLILTLIGLLWNNLYRLNRNYLLIGALFSLLVPLVNGWVTGDWMWTSWRGGEYYVFAVDLFWTLTALSALIICYLMERWSFVSTSKEINKLSRTPQKA